MINSNSGKIEANLLKSINNKPQDKIINDYLTFGEF